MSVEADERGAKSRWDRVFAAAAASPRRQIVASLLEAPPERELRLPEAANPPYDRRDPETLYNELVHEHLPLLADEGFATWQRDPLRVGRGPEFEEIGVVIDTLQTNAGAFPPRLVEGCQRLEQQRERGES